MPHMYVLFIESGGQLPPPPPHPLLPPPLLEPLLEDDTILSPEDHGLQQFLCVNDQCLSQSY